MEWVTRFNETIDYIEGVLTDEIDYNKLAQIGLCSSFHYQRMFAYMAGMPLSEYIRRRRMSRAAVDLQNGDTIMDVALRYGYSSPTAFNRAFQSIHGVAPSVAKKGGVPIQSFTPINFTITIKGTEAMKYRIEHLDQFRIVGISMPLHKEIEKNFEIVPPMWGKAAMDGTLQHLAAVMNNQPMGLLGVSVCNDDKDWRYFIAVSSTAAVDGAFEEHLVPAATWAVFSGEGTSQSIQALEKRIVTEWLPTSGYEYGDAPDIEVYLNADPDNSKYEVWLPVVKKV